MSCALCVEQRVASSDHSQEAKGFLLLTRQQAPHENESANRGTRRALSLLDQRRGFSSLPRFEGKKRNPHSIVNTKVSTVILVRKHTFAREFRSDFVEWEQYIGRQARRCWGGGCLIFGTGSPQGPSICHRW